jgi:cytochrome c-type biogenesis protein CcmF
LNIGIILIWLSFLTGICAAISVYREYKKNNINGSLLSIKLERACLISIGFSMLLLVYYLYTINTSYSYVFEHSSAELEWYYRLSALWAGQEGSLLLWSVSIMMMLLIVEHTQEIRLSETALMHIIRLVSLSVVCVFIGLLVLKNPFSAYYAVPGGSIEITNWNPFIQMYEIPYGQGMNPLLRNPWMALHPPILFFGYAAFTIPFAAAMFKLLAHDDGWEFIATRWMRISWLFLTVGIGLGGFWAYEVLGWGAWYWSWDPVETSSLIPWITATAYLHAQLRYREGEYNLIAPFLAIFSFIMVMFATFVTRSGIWASVHSWQDFNAQSATIALFLGILIISSTLLVLKNIAATTK